MDKPRPSQARKKRIKRIIYGTLVILVGSGITLGLSRLKPAAPRVDRATVYIDTVKRGEMLRQVRGLGMHAIAIRFSAPTSVRAWRAVSEHRLRRLGSIAACLSSIGPSTSSLTTGCQTTS